MDGEPLGVILAGGPGKRLGGKKPWRMIGDKRLIDLALENISQVCRKVVVVAVDIGQFADLPCQLIADRWPGQGPLAALATAMLETEEDGFLVLPVDLPLVRVPLLELILSKRHGQRSVSVQGPGGKEPLLAYYSRECLPTALRMLEQGERRPTSLLNSIRPLMITREQVHEVDPDDLSFINVNFPEDLEKARRIMGGGK